MSTGSQLPRAAHARGNPDAGPGAGEGPRTKAGTRIFWVVAGPPNNGTSRHRAFVYDDWLSARVARNRYYRRTSRRGRSSDGQLPGGVRRLVIEVDYFFRSLRDRLWNLAMMATSNVVILQRKFPDAFERLVLRLSGGRVFFDFDDAIFLRLPPIHQEDEAPVVEVDPEVERRLRRTLERCDGAIVSNDYLADWARRFQPHVAVGVTSVRVDGRQTWKSPAERFVIGWIGAPENQRYLMQVFPGIRRILDEFEQAELHVVTSHHWDFQHPKVRRLPWDLETYGDHLDAFDVGLAPLASDAWTRGKMQFRAIQYAAQKVPVIGSPVGYDRRLWVDGKNLLLASDADAYYHRIRELILDPERRRELAEAAFQVVRQHYDCDRNARGILDFVTWERGRC